MKSRIGHGEKNYPRTAFQLQFQSFSVVQIDSLLMPSLSNRQLKFINRARLKRSWFW
mgnify:CR=1 FL=1